MQKRVEAAPANRGPRAQVTRSDTRWLLAWVGVFLAAMLALLAVHQVYRLTGPHPQVTVFVRRLKHYARWLIPGLKGRRSSHLLPVPGGPPGPRHAGSSRASGHDAQRGNA
jgi:hypothetical protein